MSLITRTTINTGDILTATQWNTQFDTAYTEVNGLLNSANLADGAVITAKIADANITGAKFGAQIDWANTQSVAFQEATCGLTGGTATSALANFSGVFTRLGNIAAATVIAGIGGGRNGRFLILYNPNAFNLTFANESATETTATNRIITCTGADATSTGACSAMLIYSNTDTRWILLNLWG